jgi:DNA-directed RNA polymerase subunit M/transcription elongation factor TFIIS
MPRVKCPKCQEALEVEEADLGSMVECPECGKQFRLPSRKKPEAAPPKKEEAAPFKVADTPPPPKVTDPDMEDLTGYGVNQDDEGPSADASQARQVEQMVQRADRLRIRKKAWKLVGEPTKWLKVMCVTTIVYLTIGFVSLLVLSTLWAYKFKAEENKKREAAATAKEKGEEPPPADNEGPKTTKLEDSLFGDAPYWLVLLIIVVVCGVQYALLGLTLTGSEKMKKFDSYNWCMAGSIIGMIIGLLYAGGAVVNLIQVFDLLTGEDPLNGILAFAGWLIFNLPPALILAFAIWMMVLLRKQEIIREFEWQPGTEEKLDEEDAEEEEEQDEEEEDEEEEEEEEKRRPRRRR